MIPPALRQSIQRQIQLWHIHMRFTEDSQQLPLNMLNNQIAHNLFVQATQPCDTWRLILRRRRTDVKIKPAGCVCIADKILFGVILPD
jgi:hypothetical protein